MKQVLFRLVALLVIMLGTGLAQTALACPVCYTDPESNTSTAVAYAVFALMGVTGTVLGGFIGLFVYLRRRAKKMTLNGAVDFPSVN